MYSYDRRQATGRPRDYVEALEQAIRGYGVKRGLERKVAQARQLAVDLDREVQYHKGVSADDEWAHDSSKEEKLWRDLDKLFDHCFGFHPPKLGTI